MKDTRAYRAFFGGYLLYHDWSEYRNGNSGRALLGRHIRFDASLSGCQRVLEKHDDRDVLRCIRYDGNETNAEHYVIETDITFGFNARRVWVESKGCQSSDGQLVPSFRLTAEVKRCLRVRDGDGYHKFVADTERREARQRYEKGEVQASDRTILKDVVEEVQVKAKEARQAKDAQINSEGLPEDSEGEVQAMNRSIFKDVVQAMQRKAKQSTTPAKQSTTPSFFHSFKLSNWLVSRSLHPKKKAKQNGPAEATVSEEEVSEKEREKQVAFRLQDVAQAGNSVLKEKLGIESLELEVSSQPQISDQAGEDFDAQELTRALQDALEGFSEADAEAIA